MRFSMRTLQKEPQMRETFGVDSALHLNGDAIDATNHFLFALGSARGQKLCAPAESILEVRLE